MLQVFRLRPLQVRRPEQGGRHRPARGAGEGAARAVAGGHFEAAHAAEAALTGQLRPGKKGIITSYHVTEPHPMQPVVNMTMPRLRDMYRSMAECEFMQPWNR